MENSLPVKWLREIIPFHAIYGRLWPDQFSDHYIWPEFRWCSSREPALGLRMWLALCFSIWAKRETYIWTCRFVTGTEIKIISWSFRPPCYLRPSMARSVLGSLHMTWVSMVQLPWACFGAWYVVSSMFFHLSKERNVHMNLSFRHRHRDKNYKSLSQVINNGAYAPGDMVSFRVDQNIGGNEPNA
jgi:hypothetical protein